MIGGPWSLAIYGKGHQQWTFLDNGPFASGKVLEFKFKGQFHPSFLVLCTWGKTLAPGAAGAQSSVFCACFGRMACSFGLQSLESSSVSC